MDIRAGETQKVGGGEGGRREGEREKEREALSTFSIIAISLNIRLDSPKLGSSL